MHLLTRLALAATALCATLAAAEPAPFHWPQGKRAAVTFSFDDARLTQADVGLPLFDKHGVKATFLVSPAAMARRLDKWKQAVANGHDIGSHTGSHPCTANYGGSWITNALEDYDLKRMAADIDRSIAVIKRDLGVNPVSFAYPCGQKWVGRGRERRSYVPLIAERFLVGRGYLDEAGNDPRFCDLSAAMGMGGDDLSAAEMTALVRKAIKDGRWLILVGHEVGSKAFQTTDVAALEAVFAMAKDPANGLWVDTMASVARYVQKTRGKE